MKNKTLGLIVLFFAINCPWKWLTDRLIWLSWSIRGLKWGKDHNEIADDFKFERKYKLFQ